MKDLLLPVIHYQIHHLLLHIVMNTSNKKCYSYVKNLIFFLILDLHNIIFRLPHITDDEIKDSSNNSTVRSSKTLLTKEDTNWYEYGCV